MEQDEIREKNKRRSSILKTPKSRNPFEEIDVIEPCDDTSMAKPARRVSFASSNFIKQFAPDPEKVTIWDTTYEEDVNHTNSTQSTQSSREHLMTTSSKTEQSTEFFSICGDISTNVLVQDMELTQQSFYIDKENIPYCPPSKISIVNYAKKISSGVVSHVSFGGDDAGKAEPHSLDKTLTEANPVESLGLSEMDFTCQVPAKNICPKPSKNNTILIDVELTGKLPPNEISSKMADEDLLSCQAPINVIVEAVANVDDMDFTCQVPKLPVPSLDMELTCNLPQNIINDATNLEVLTNDLDLTCQETAKGISFVNSPMSVGKSDTDLEFTCQGETKNVLLPEKMNENMDISYRKVPDSNTKPVPYKTPESGQDCLSLKSNDMDFTCHSTTKNLIVEQLGNSNGAIANVQASDQSEIDMEFTCQVKMKKTRVPEQMNMTTNTSLDMEFTRKIPLNNNALECQENQLLTGDGMDIRYQETPVDLNIVKPLTCKLPELRSDAECLSLKSNDMSFTRQAITKNVNMQSLEDENGANVRTSDQSEINMEFTCQVQMRNANLEQMPVKTHVSSNSVLDMEHQPMSMVDMDISYQEDVNAVKSPIKTSIDASIHNKTRGKSTEINGVNEVKDTSHKISRATNPKEYLDFIKADSTNFTFETSNLKLKNGTELSLLSPLGKDNIKIPQNDQLKLAPLDSPDIPTHSSMHQSKSLREGNHSSHIQNYLSLETPQKKAQFEESLQQSFLDSVKDSGGYTRRTPLKNDSRCKIPLRKPVPFKSPKNSRILSECNSACRTPESSFHINLTNLSSGADDTQHLLKCTYYKPDLVSLMTSRMEEKSENCPLNFESIAHISKPELADSHLDGSLEIGKAFAENSPDASLYDIPKNKLACINDTYVLKKKLDGDKDIDNTHPIGSNDSATSSIGILTEDNMVIESGSNEISNTELRNIDSEPEGNENTKIELRKNVKIKRLSEVPDIMENINTQNKQIFGYLQNFSFKSLQVPELIDTKKTRQDSIESTPDTIEENDDACPSIETRVTDHQKSCQNCWKLENTQGITHHFSTLFGTLGFVVEVDVETNRVTNIETINRLAVSSEPLARFIFKSFKNKLSSGVIKSALGDSYDILSLLDYVKMSMLRFHSFQKDFFKSNLTMDKDFRVIYKVRSVPLVCAFKVLVDVTDLEHFNYSKDIGIKFEIGAVNENEIKQLAENCPKNLDLFVSFRQKLEDYITLKEKRKILPRMKELR